MKKALVVSYLINLFVVGAFIYVYMGLPTPVNTNKTVIEQGKEGAQGPVGLTASPLPPLPALIPKDGQDGSITTQTITVPGPAAQDGAPGASAYELAVQSGYEGTQDEWLASLKGNDGQMPEIRCNVFTKQFEYKAPDDSFWKIIGGSQCVQVNT